MNAVVRALGIETRFMPRIAGLPVGLRPAAPLSRLAPPGTLEDPHAPACSAVGEDVDMIVAERARVSTARARGPAAGWRKELA
jgi:hypothetical protein